MANYAESYLLGLVCQGCINEVINIKLPQVKREMTTRMSNEMLH